MKTRKHFGIITIIYASLIILAGACAQKNDQKNDYQNITSLQTLVDTFRLHPETRTLELFERWAELTTTVEEQHDLLEAVRIAQRDAQTLQATSKWKQKRLNETYNRLQRETLSRLSQSIKQELQGEMSTERLARLITIYKWSVDMQTFYTSDGRSYEDIRSMVNGMENDLLQAASSTIKTLSDGKAILTLTAKEFNFNNSRLYEQLADTLLERFAGKTTTIEDASYIFGLFYDGTQNSYERYKDEDPTYKKAMEHLEKLIIKELPCAKTIDAALTLREASPEKSLSRHLVDLKLQQNVEQACVGANAEKLYNLRAALLETPAAAYVEKKIFNIVNTQSCTK